jgi:hypothetical protein
MEFGLVCSGAWSYLERKSRSVEMMVRALQAGLVLLLLFPVLVSAQEEKGGRIIFTDPKSNDDAILTEDDLAPRAHSWGGDLMIGTDGFGLGFFYGYTFDDLVTVFADLSLSEAKDGNQRDYYDPYFGQVSPNKTHYIFRVPLFLGLQYRLFKDDIVENFRPYLSAGAGPVLLYVTPVSGDVFSSFFGGGTSKYTYGGFVGAGARFGFDRSSIFGLDIRYMMIPVPSGVSSVIVPDPDNPGQAKPSPLANANGFYIALNFGTTF